MVEHSHTASELFRLENRELKFKKTSRDFSYAGHRKTQNLWE